ncbi:uncharacterized protein CANTADRAFT_25892 [Suhomyces tanzawaensis NRRL Y-17324]|uniref:RanBD1 domain-containing protein n=1 Tax=Suhomyces tanzawaensis NRRL Y-17324 TaxID=984487 RepID=A0A1E4SL40_9ASCO|nr:uncharacterized protein CANTADRAFT_25892 [Suhomyces tanzawaensis NRRL Y-17324]ODV80219.1 hypothetical protein CANTADRAFT_25892 [Suhomyces tanzawaensis NRRL Y-17324]
MSKRVADKQITSDFPGDQEDSDEPQVFKALSDVMAKRKILKPRGHGGAGAGNPFKGVQSRGSSFAFNKSAESSFKPIQNNVSAPTPNKDDDKNNKLRALNEKFIETLNKANVPNTVLDFTAAAKKYIEYYEQIQKGSIASTSNPSASSTLNSNPVPSNNMFNFAPKVPTSTETKPATAEVTKPAISFGNASTSAPKQDSSSDSDSDLDEDIKIQGPQFTLASKPTVKNSPFSFGPKPAKKVDSDSDSESEIEIKGPTFTFDKQIKDNVFKLEPTTSKASIPQQSQAEAKPAALFGASTTSKLDQPQPSFSWGSSAPKSAFSLGSKADATKEPEVPQKQAFNFQPSSTSISEKEESAKPLSTNLGSSASPTPLLFGSKPENKAEKVQDKPLFNFKPSVTNESSTASSDTSKPLFNFTSTNSSNDKPATAGLFSFPTLNLLPLGSSEKKDEAPKPFSFASTEKKDTTNLFSITPTEKKDEAPKPFVFGTSGDSSKPFAFGSGNTSSGLVKPANGGLFGSSNNGGLFGGSTNGGGVFGSNGSAGKKDEVEDEKVPEEETGGDFKPVAQLASEKIDTPNTGEEGEEVLYTKKAKLMLFDPENKELPYVNKGLGDLKLLKNTQTQKSRVLIRADGGLRILLNAAVSKDFTYSTIGNGSMVRFPTIKPEDKKLETFVIKVKTPADGEELLQSINGAK